MNFYEFSQNNTGGSFVTDDKLCHRVVIEAASEKEAIQKAEEMGIYFNGVDDGMDCPCCGDRWYTPDKIDLERINTEWNGYELSVWLTSGKPKGTLQEDVIMQNIKSAWPQITWLEGPKLENKYDSARIVGKIRLDNVEMYLQLLANMYGWTTPDARIFYANGDVVEIVKHDMKDKMLNY